MSFSLFDITRLIGVDLGTSQVRIWTDKDGLVIDEPSCIAIDKQSKRVVAVGGEALQMQGRVGKNIQVYFPIRKAKVNDLDLTRAMLRVYLQRVFKASIFSPDIMASIPANATPVMKKTISSLFYSLGANRVYTIAQPLAAAIGAGVPIADASACFILQMGAGVVEGAVISLGSLVVFQSMNKAGLTLDEQIQYQTKQEKNLLISRKTAEELKHNIASVLVDHKKEALIVGKDLRDKSPKELTVDCELLYKPLSSYAQNYENLLKRLLSKIQAELVVDVIDKGMILSGGLAQIDGLVDYFIKVLGIPVSVVDKPERCVIEGIATVLEHLDEFKQSLGYER